MRQKASRRIPGTFAEIGNLIRSFTQVMFDHIRNFDDEYWLWLLEIRMFLRYILMPEISQSQLKAMNETLIDLMNTRLRLTKIKNSSDDDTTELSEESESCESCDSSDSDREELVPENEKSLPLVEETYEPEPPELEPVKEEKKGFCKFHYLQLGFDYF